MKKLFAMMLLALTMLAVACPVWAADVPVYFRGHLTTTGLERDGAIYLSERALFESMALEVSYTEASQKINLTFNDQAFQNGGQLDMQVGSRDADYNRDYINTESGERGSDHAWFYLEHVPFVKDGLVYLPIRFVAEDVLGCNVEWKDGAVYIDLPYTTCTVGEDEYSLCLASGDFYHNGERVFRLKLPGYANCHNLAVTGGLQVRRTEAGAYLLQAEGRNTGGLIKSLRWYAWIFPTSDGYSSQTAYISTMQSADWLPGIVQSPGRVWLNDGVQIFCLDEASGQVQTFDQNSWMAQTLGDDMASGYLQWTDGRLALLGDTDGYVLWDMQAEQGVDLTPLLLTDAVRAEAEEYLLAEALVDFRPDTDFAYYWKGLGRQNLAVGDVYPYLHFLGEEAGRLQFELRCHYHTSGYGDAGQATFPLSIDLAQIKIGE